MVKLGEVIQGAACPLCKVMNIHTELGFISYPAKWTPVACALRWPFVVCGECGFSEPSVPVSQIK